jgi:hypothetical protein
VSQPDLSSSEPRGVLVAKPKTSIYTVMLLIALLALTFSCLVLLLEWSRYSFQHKPPANLRAAWSAAPVQIEIS